MDEAVCRWYGRQFARKIIDMLEYKEADTIICYAACKGEADTWILIEKALEIGNRVALPRVTGPAEMHFYTRRSFLHQCNKIPIEKSVSYQVRTVS